MTPEQVAPFAKALEWIALNDSPTAVGALKEAVVGRLGSVRLAAHLYGHAVEEVARSVVAIRRCAAVEYRRRMLERGVLDEEGIPLLTATSLRGDAVHARRRDTRASVCGRENVHIDDAAFELSPYSCKRCLSTLVRVGLLTTDIVEELT